MGMYAAGIWGEFGANFIGGGSASGAVFLGAFFIPRGAHMWITLAKMWITMS